MEPSVSISVVAWTPGVCGATRMLRTERVELHCVCVCVLVMVAAHKTHKGQQSVLQRAAPARLLSVQKPIGWRPLRVPPTCTFPNRVPRLEVGTVAHVVWRDLLVTSVPLSLPLMQSDGSRRSGRGPAHARPLPKKQTKRSKLAGRRTT